MNLLQQYQTHPQPYLTPGYLKGSDLNEPNVKVKYDKTKLFLESNIHQHNNQQQQTIQNRSSIQKIINIKTHFPSSANFMANINDSIPQGKLPVNNQTASLTDVTAPNPGAAKIIPNQTADKLINKSDNTLSLVLDNTLINFNIS